MIDKDKDSFYAKDRKSWRNWLMKNHAKRDSIWLLMYHRKSETPSVYYEEAVEEALCFGWIDSKPNKRDHESYYQYFTKRKQTSKWSKINKGRVKKLIEAGLMHASGLEVINRSKANKTWTALDQIEKLTVPADLQKLFNLTPKAKSNFDAFPKSVKRAILEWIDNAKREETRKKRVEETVKLASQNIRANQYVKKI